MTDPWTKERWVLFTLMSTAGTSYRIFFKPDDGGPSQAIAHIPMAWAGDGRRARLIAEAPALIEALHNTASLLRAFATPDDPVAQAALDEAAAVLARVRGEKEPG